jgi:hypothetical protein
VAYPVTGVGFPVGEELEGVGGGAVGLGVVGEEDEAFVGGEGHDLEGEAEFANEGMVERLAAGAAVATDLPSHITDAAMRQNVEQAYSTVTVTAADIAEVIAFAVERPRRLAINEILLRPANQP